ncbi:unnamed protein product [Peronospora belbahrii]|uniref:Ankyrin repeat-containing domain n=1 Tax=Peronospora belbahrii TaxID=622444 RepID=A0ABN8CNG2_9STRA|nr:unnamed protein product [Peronospora belbahrii]
MIQCSELVLSLNYSTHILYCKSASYCSLRLKILATHALPNHIKALSHVVQRINEFVIPETIDAAVYNDCQYIIRVHGATKRWTTKAMDGAAARGRLDLVKWLSVTRSEGCTIAAIDGAARNGHLKMVKWLCKHYVRRCSSNALNAAAENGHVEVVKWLCRHNRGRDPFALTYGVQAIARTGDTDALRAILHNQTLVAH